MLKTPLLFADFEKSLTGFEEVLSSGKSFVYTQAAIKTFEITTELAWKLIQTYLSESNGFVCNSPKECVRIAFQNELISDDIYWLEIIDIRNRTVHTYSQKYIEHIYQNHLPKALTTFQNFYHIIKQKIK
jgi:nucleotidyltransferase substrate binding protein (TIGR01987 family)